MTRLYGLQACGMLLLWSLLSQQVRSFSTSSSTPPVKRVAIIGSGIAGLSLAHALTNSPELAKCTPESRIEVSLFDSRPSFDFNAGSGVQLNGGKQIGEFELSVACSNTLS
jgi:hypothetical protein